VLDVVLRGVEGFILGCLLVAGLVVCYNPSSFTYYDPGVQKPWEYDVPVVDPWWKEKSKATLLTEETRQERTSIRNNALIAVFAYVFVYLSRVGFGRAWNNAQQRLEWFDENVVR